MVNIPTEVLDLACAAYARATGTYPNRAGLRAALHSIDLRDACDRDSIQLARVVQRDHRGYSDDDYNGVR